MGKASEVSVEGVITALDYPLKAEVIALRDLLLAVDPSIGEQIKRNAPGFHTTEHFATLQLRKPEVLGWCCIWGRRRGSCRRR